MCCCYYRCMGCCYCCTCSQGARGIRLLTVGGSVLLGVEQVWQSCGDFYVVGR